MSGLNIQYKVIHHNKLQMNCSNSFLTTSVSGMWSRSRRHGLVSDKVLSVSVCIVIWGTKTKIEFVGG